MAEGKHFVGFGFGPIQGGLFLLEAFLSGCFSRLTVAEIDPELVALLRGNQGRYTVNVACEEAIQKVTVGPVEILNPTVPTERSSLVERVANAHEAATAVPSVANYNGREGSVAWIIARALRRRTLGEPLCVYAAENHNRAAELLSECVAAHAGSACENVEYLNTVIGKMSGVVRLESGSGENDLAALVPGADRAFLVESFNRILVTRPRRVQRALHVFEEKDDLLPFEEAKLYGHNAAHALLGFLAAELGLTHMPQAAHTEGLLPFVLDAFVNEAGRALCKKWHHCDPLFTPRGFQCYAEDLLTRMTRATLNDAVRRVVRDPARKLGPEDRFFGTIALCKHYGTGGARFAFGAACALAHMASELRTAQQVKAALSRLWKRGRPELLAAAHRGWELFCLWRTEGRPPLAGFWKRCSER